MDSRVALNLAANGGIMPAQLTKLILIGNLGADPEVALVPERGKVMQPAHRDLETWKDATQASVAK